MGCVQPHTTQNLAALRKYHPLTRELLSKFKVASQAELI